MKIAVIPTIREWPWGAPGACMGALVEALLSKGHEVLWLVAPIDLDHPEVSRLSARGARVATLPDPAPKYGAFRTLRRHARAIVDRTPALRTVLDEFLPEHIFVNQGGAWSALGDESLMVCLRRWRGRYSLIVHLNQPQYPFPSNALADARDLAAGAVHVYFNSAWVRELSELQICQPIAQAAFFQPPVRPLPSEPLDWPDHEVPRFAMMCRLDAYQKGIDLALCAMARLKFAGVPAMLGIYGDGPDREYLLQLIEHLRIGDRVALHGHKDIFEVVWKSNEMLLLPSRFEGLGVSMLEAMGCGRPVLRTPHGGAAEWIEDGVNGYLCQAAEADTLFATMTRALADRPNWRGQGLRAHEKIVRNLDRDPARTFLGALPA